jgi:hypothetical protein
MLGLLWFQALARQGRDSLRSEHIVKRSVGTEVGHTLACSYGEAELAQRLRDNRPLIEVPDCLGP